MGSKTRLPFLGGALADYLRLSAASGDPSAINSPLYDPVIRGEIVTIRILSINGQEAPGQSLQRAIAGFSRCLVGQTRAIMHRPIELQPDRDGQLTLQQIDSAIAQLDAIRPCDVLISLAPAISDLPYRGSCRLLPTGGHIIHINARRMHAGAKRLLPPPAWWRLVLQHELMHTLDLPADRSRRWRGAHCTNPNCLLYARVDLASIAAAAVRMRPPASLCKDCRRELKAAQDRDSRRIAPDEPYDLLPRLYQLIDLNPRHFQLYLDRGGALYERGEYKRAIADYDRALSLKPGDGLALANRGLAHSRLGNHKQADSDLSTAIADDPRHALRYRSRALAYARAGRFDEALADLQHCLSLTPDDRLAQSNMAWLLATCDDEAIRDGIKALSLAAKVCNATDWKASWALSTLAAACAETGRCDLAAKHQQRAISLAGESRSDAMLRHLELYLAGKPCRECAPA